MAFGVHWEWRGFATPHSASVDRILALSPKFPTSQVLTDHYLWVPGASVNVKLRLGDLKFKRLVATEDDYERWVEQESENHAFPIDPSVVEGLFGSLGIPLRSVPQGPVGRAAFLELIGRDAPSVRLVSVDKERQQYDWLGLGGLHDEPVIVEVARIGLPQRLTSVGLEHPDLSRVRAAREALGLSSGFRSLSYLEAVAAWGRGDRIVA